MPYSGINEYLCFHGLGWITALSISLDNDKWAMTISLETAVRKWATCLWVNGVEKFEPTRLRPKLLIDHVCAVSRLLSDQDEGIRIVDKNNIVVEKWTLSINKTDRASRWLVTLLCQELWQLPPVIAVPRQHGDNGVLLWHIKPCSIGLIIVLVSLREGDKYVTDRASSGYDTSVRSGWIQIRCVPYPCLTTPCCHFCHLAISRSGHLIHQMILNRSIYTMWKTQKE